MNATSKVQAVVVDRGLLFEELSMCSMLFEGFEKQSKPCKKAKGI